MSTTATKDYVPYLNFVEDLEASYTRCRLVGVPVERTKPQIILPEAQFIPLLAANIQLLAITDCLITPISFSRPQKEYIFILCDMELMTLKTFGSQDALEAAEKVGVSSGTVFTEESCGTNALSLAREHGGIVTIRGEQHYCILFKNWLSMAGPVKDTKGKIKGYLGILMPTLKELGFAAELLKILLVAIEKEILLLNLDLTGMQLKPSSPLSSEIKKELTAREQDIYKLLLRRLSSKEIAVALNLSVLTVRTHRKNIYQKLGVNGLSGLLEKFAGSF